MYDVCTYRCPNGVEKICIPDMLEANLRLPGLSVIENCGN